MSEQGPTAHPVGDRPAAPAAWRRWGLGAGIGACLAAGSFGVALLVFGRSETTTLLTEWTDRFAHGGADAVAPPPASPRPGADAGATAPPSRERAGAQADAAPAAAKPSFDIVRVSPSGSGVLAGRAAPNADVIISDNGAAVGHAQADARGDWVFLPSTPLKPGGSELTLASRAPDGAVTHGDSPVIVLVPPVAAGPPGATIPPALPPAVLLTPADAPPRLLQLPSEPSQPGGGGRVQLGLDVVDYDDRGGIRFAGRAPAGSDIRLYIDRQAAGDARSDGLGRWSLTPERTVDAGAHQLRVDQLSETGRVAARIELPFERVEIPADASPVAAGEERVVVQPRQTLWALARHAYGRGVRYTIIYAANRDQIRNPDRIYPGQVFAVPAPQTAPNPQAAPVP
jgi:hypothetical protein